MKTSTPREPRVMLSCACGCGHAATPNRVKFVRVPGDGNHRLLLKSHIEPYTEERETLQQLLELARGLYNHPIHKRFAARHRVRLLKYRYLRRLRGEAVATREADRAALLCWLPKWIGNRLAKRWEAAEARDTAELRSCLGEGL